MEPHDEVEAAPNSIATVLDALRADADELSTDICQHIWEQLDSYTHIDGPTLEASIRRNLGISLRALESGSPPAADSLAEAVQTASERFVAGIPVEEIIRSFRVCIADIHARFIDLCLSYGVESADAITGSAVLWGVGDAFTTKIVTTYHALEMDAALRDAQQRVSVARALLSGRTPPSELTQHGLAPDSLYAAIRCQVPLGTDAERVRRLLESSGSKARQAAAFVAVDDGVCLGLVAQRPTTPGAPVGIGPFVPIAEIATSDAVAATALRVCQQLNRAGILGLEELGWRLAAATRPEVTKYYSQKYLHPLINEGEFGTEIITTVRAYIDCAFNIGQTAEKLCVHVNTARYRLRRFEELTGVKVSSPENIIGIIWAWEFATTPKTPPPTISAPSQSFS